MVFCVLVRLLTVLGGSESVAGAHWALLGDRKPRALEDRLTISVAF